MSTSAIKVFVSAFLLCTVGAAIMLYEIRYRSYLAINNYLKFADYGDEGVLMVSTRSQIIFYLLSSATAVRLKIG